ncbi:MAG: glucose 1-dehydrogenase [Candidatus Gracilibacteria bacterium]|nr:glucose 1-dehydrogenase [Candidatus Gracilibacteria bacterium]
MKLKNKIALITGGAAGIGEAIAREFSNSGATVIIADINLEAGKKLEQELENSYFIKLDVTNETAWQSAFKEIIDKYGRVDILVNNAGILGNNFGPQDPENATLESWQLVHKINLESVFLGCKYFLQNNRKVGGEGNIINMASRSGIVGVPNISAYASTKAAIRNHTKSVALYACGQGLKVRCNCLNPASIMTAMWDKEDEKRLSKDIPMKRFGTPNEVAKACVFLASEDSSYITGSEINIDGGVLAGTLTSPGE